MRVTNSIVRENLLRNITADSGRLARAQAQVASGLRFQKASEDPVGAETVIRLDGRLRALEQYQRNINAAKTRTGTEEVALDQITNILTRAKELAVSQASSTATQQSRTISAGEVDQMLKQVIQLGNTKIGNEYVFGGTQASSPPFQADGTFLGDAVRRQARIGSGYVIDTNHSGQELLVDSNIIQALSDLSTQLKTGTGDDISDTLSTIDSAFDEAQGLLADIGGIERQIDLASENLEALDINLKTVRSDVRDIGLDEATINFVSIQSSLQAAMASANRILSVNLTDFLR